MVIKLNQRQETTFRAIINTYVAPLSAEEEKTLRKLAQQSSVKDEELEALAGAAGTDLDVAVTEGLGFMERATHPTVHSTILLVLTILSTTIGTFLLTGHLTPLANLSRPQKEKTLLRWKASWLPPLRQLYKLFGYMSLYPSYSRSDVLRRAIGYPYINGIDPAPVKEKLADHQVASPYYMQSLEEAAALQMEEFDVIIVGSGAGGGVIAAQVASAGKSVLVIEKGKYYQDHELGPDEISGFTKVYESQGLYSSKEGSLGIVSGNTLGGGTTVNWAASLKPYDYVLDEWAEVTGKLFDKETFKKDLETVTKRIGAATEGIEHSTPNKLLKEGCEKLGLDIHDIPQNAHGLRHDCKMCFVGCRDGVKQGTANSWLRDAEAHSARFMDQTEVKRVICKDGVATGVECDFQGTHLQFQAKVVVVSAGSLHTPNVLRRSGLNNKHLGQHLRVHPATIIQGVYDTNQDAFEGPIMTAVSDVPNNKDHYGAKIEVPSVHPALAAIGIPWRGALDHKLTMLKYRRTIPFVVIGRDMDSKHTVYEENNKVVVTSQMSKHDADAMILGIIRGFRVMAVTGAKELYHSQFAVDPFQFDDNVDPADAVNNPKFLAWLDSIKKHGMPDGTFTANLMGTCRMGKDAKVSAARVTGETWEVKNLFVGDGSLFISASGVNPMVTIEALALGVSRNVIERLNE
ncbi:unnamed protein product [Absidia cylindrospora]